MRPLHVYVKGEYLEICVCRYIPLWYNNNSNKLYNLMIIMIIQISIPSLPLLTKISKKKMGLRDNSGASTASARMSGCPVPVF